MRCAYSIVAVKFMGELRLPTTASVPQESHCFIDGRLLDHEPEGLHDSRRAGPATVWSKVVSYTVTPLPFYISYLLLGADPTRKIETRSKQ